MKFKMYSVLLVLAAMSGTGSVLANMHNCNSNAYNGQPCKFMGSRGEQNGVCRPGSNGRYREYNNGFNIMHKLKHSTMYCEVN